MYDFESLPPCGNVKMPKLSSRIYAQVKVHIRNARSECRAKLEVNTTLTHTQRIELAAQIEAYKKVLQILDDAEEAQQIAILRSQKSTAKSERTIIEECVSSLDGWFTASDVEKETGLQLKLSKKHLNALWQIGTLKKRPFSRNPTLGQGLVDQYCYRQPVVEAIELGEAGDD